MEASPGFQDFQLFPFTFSWLINTPADWDPQKVGGSVPLNPLPNSPPRRSSILLCTPFSKLKVLYTLVLIVLIVFGAVQGR